jgi:putative 4-mercaptohistidine N1-methyltranferase
MNPYETDRLVEEYLLFHYGGADEILPWPQGPRDALEYPARCVSECLDVAALPEKARALDLGCAVGRSSFELARHCAEVIGIDFSQRFITAAQTLAAEGHMPYRRTDEGTLRTPLVAHVPAGLPRERVRFLRGDAHALPAALGDFDVVLAANLIDRLVEPRRFLAQLPHLVRPGGQLILTSPYTWLPDYTPPAAWLGGFRQGDTERTTHDALRAALEPNFTLTATKDLPFLIREHARKYQWSVAQATLWRRA